MDLLLYQRNMFFMGLSHKKNAFLLFAWLLAMPMLLLAQSGSKISPQIEKKLKRDAARIALRLNASQEDLRFQPIRIPAKDIQTIYTVLATLYEQQPAAASAEKCNVHAFPDPSIDYLVLIYNKNASWAAPLQKGIYETTDTKFNALLYDYNLVIEKHVQWNESQNAITIRSRNYLNMAALANEFLNVSSIAEVDLGVPSIAGSDIDMRKTASGWQVDYILRFGGNLVSEGKKHVWRFSVSPQMKTSLVTEFGDAVPSYLRCQMEDKLFAKQM